MMEQPLLFDDRTGFGDKEYLEHVRHHPEHIVANVPNPKREFADWEIKIHRANCGHASNEKKGSLTAETQQKLVWDDLTRMREYLGQAYPNNAASTCGGCLRGR
jgi:hypothetical protein